MRVTTGWIREWLRRTMLNDSEIVQALERAGIEIEQFISSEPIDDKVVVALVKKVVQHPGADRLKLVEVETKEGKYGVVCGAPNVREGMKVAFAQIGTVLPGGDRIAKAKLRGEVSEGMLCSEFELKLGLDHGGIMELSSDVAVGAPLCDIYASESVVDVKTPANRFDVQSIVGLAREVAAMTTAELIPLADSSFEVADSKGVLADTIAAEHYMLARIKVSHEAHSPLSMAARLRAVGMRSIGPVVDVTNYVLLETGQPLHAFDAAKVTLPMIVRHAQTGESLVTLDGVQRRLTEADLVVADQKGPIALAGLMGGQSTEVSAETTEILLEAAVFDGVVVRKMAQRHGLRTEASGRFERGIPAELPPLGLARAIHLLSEVASGNVAEVYEYSKAAGISKPESIRLRVARLSKQLGFGISANEAVEMLGKLQISAQIDDAVGENSKSDHNHDEVVKTHNELNGEAILAEVPWWRPDLKEPEDLVEEVVRVVGYERVPSTIPSWRPRRIEFDHLRAVSRQVREVLWAAGAFEVMTYSFVSLQQLVDLGLDAQRHLKLKNPLSIEQAYLRSTLMPSHLATLERNRTYARALRFYEISKVFLKRGKDEQPDEPLRLGVTVLEPEGAYMAAKGLLDEVAKVLNVGLVVRPADLGPYAPGRCAEVWLGDVRLGEIGQLHPAHVRELKLDGEVAYFELDLTPLMLASKARAYVAPSAFPTMWRDVALLVPQDVTWQTLEAATERWEVSFVGDYYGAELPEGMKGMTIRVHLSFPDRTPTEAEALELEESILARLRNKFGAQRRS